MTFRARLSTDADGISRYLGLQAEARIKMAQIIAALQAKMSTRSLFTPL